MKIISTFVSSVLAAIRSAGNKTRWIPPTTDAALILTGGFQRGGSRMGEAGGFN